MVNQLRHRAVRLPLSVPHCRPRNDGARQDVAHRGTSGGGGDRRASIRAIRVPEAECGVRNAECGTRSEEQGAKSEEGIAPTDSSVRPTDREGAGWRRVSGSVSSQYLDRLDNRRYNRRRGHDHIWPPDYSPMLEVALRAVTGRRSGFPSPWRSDPKLRPAAALQSLRCPLWSAVPRHRVGFPKVLDGGAKATPSRSTPKCAITRRGLRVPHRGHDDRRD